MKILTFNCFITPLSPHVNFRITRLVDYLLASEFEIICLQEVSYTYVARKISKKLSDNGYNVFYHSNGLLVAGGLLIASKFPMIDSEFYKYEEQGKLISFSFADVILGKGFLHVTLECNSGNLDIINTHLISEFPMRNDLSCYNNLQLKELSKYVSHISAGNLIICGDFNTQQSINASNVTRVINNNDTKTVEESNTNRKGFYSIKVNDRVDNIFYGTRIKEVYSDIVLDNPWQKGKKLVHLSDHYGIYMDFDIQD